MTEKREPNSLLPVARADKSTLAPFPSATPTSPFTISDLGLCAAPKCEYPSAMGSGKNIVLFDAAKAEVLPPVSYSRIKRVAYFDAPIAEYEDVDHEGPYDFVLKQRSAQSA